MSLTLEELCEKLKDVDEITLLERLNLSSEDLVERYKDVIENIYEQLVGEFEEEDDH